MSSLTTLSLTTGEVVERAPLHRNGNGSYACPYCSYHMPAMRVTTRGRLDLALAIQRGLAIPICDACGGVWADMPAAVKDELDVQACTSAEAGMVVPVAEPVELAVPVVTGKVERGRVVVAQEVRS